MDSETLKADRELVAKIIREIHYTRNDRVEDQHTISFPTTHHGPYAAADAILAALANHSEDARVERLREVTEWVANEMTVEESMNSSWATRTPEERVARMGERRRSRDAIILKARAALAEGASK